MLAADAAAAMMLRGAMLIGERGEAARIFSSGQRRRKTCDERRLLLMRDTPLPLLRALIR